MTDNSWLNKLDQEIKNGDVSPADSQSLKDLLAENLKYSQAIYEDTQKIRRYMFIRMVINIVWVILVLTPLIIAFLYLPPAVKEFYGAYQGLIGQSQGAFDLFDQLNQLR